MTMENRLLIGLALLAIVDIVLPVPLTALAVGYVVVSKPAWARRAVAELFGSGPGAS